MNPAHQGLDDTPTTAPLLCTVDQAAEALAIGRTKTFELISDGSIRTVQIGRRRLVPVSELESYVTGLLEAS
ncbi:MAG: excisionase family DNA-binding protein [Actinomycetota bacterium]